jgi:glycerol-3-phosphate acyltransferase PlsY
MYRLIALLIGYAIGCLQTAFFVGKIKGIDIREHGSKNAGMTNVTRTIGKRWGAFVFVVDIIKGAATFVVVAHFMNNDLSGLYAGLGVIIGHCFPFWLKFRGGKGVSSTLGVMLVVHPLVALCSYALGLTAVIVTRYISLASLVITLAFPIGLAIVCFQAEAIIIMSFVTALIWLLHRENIKRLLRGEERKFLKKE